MQNTNHLIVILDRDGVINEDSEDYIKTPEEWQPIQGSLQSIAMLKRAGYLVAIATNQSGIARGLFDTDTLDAVHGKLLKAVGDAGGRIDAMAICPHSPEAGCHCRKPKPGLLVQISEQLNVSLDQAWFVGDSLRDLQAAIAAGARPALVRTGNGEATLRQIATGSLSSTPVFTDLKQFTESLLGLPPGQFCDRIR